MKKQKDLNNQAEELVNQLTALVDLMIENHEIDPKDMSFEFTLADIEINGLKGQFQIRIELDKDQFIEAGLMKAYDKHNQLKPMAFGKSSDYVN